MSVENPSVHTSRKDQHLALAAEQGRAEHRLNDFDHVDFCHHALDGIEESQTSLSTDVGPWHWSTPLYINGMTGGTNTAHRINRDLAITAAATRTPMASGSMSVAIDHPDTADSFKVIRDENPHGFVMANLGAHRSPDDAARVVDLLRADALQLHVNAVQETVMAEGRRDFSVWARSIEAIAASSPVPVIVKEVGFGLSRRTQRQLADLGVKVADVSGAGGTNFAQIENSRRERPDFSFMQGYGLSAVCCLLDAPMSPRLDLLASGGVRSPLDVIKALALGAKAVGVAGTFLPTVFDGGAEALIAVVERWKVQLRQLLALLGARTPTELTSTDVLLRGPVREFCELRGIDPGAYSRRTEIPPSTHDCQPTQAEPRIISDVY